MSSATLKSGEMSPPVEGLPVFDPFSSDFATDPYLQYRSIVQRNPVHFSDRIGGWVVARYAENNRLFRDLRLKSRPDRLGAPLKGRALESLSTRMLTGLISHVDPPLHTRMRSITREAFHHAPIETLKPFVRDRVNNRLDQLVGKGDFDLVGEFSLPLSTDVISRVLGVPPGDGAELLDATNGLFHIFDPLPTPEIQARIDGAVVRFREYFSRLIGERRRQPREDLISALVHGVRPEMRLSDNDIVSNCTLIYGAGRQSPGNLIAGSVLALSQFPDQWQVLQEGPAAIPPAVEEFLRFATPSQFSARSASVDISCGGQTFARGDVIFLLNAAANRDPEIFHEPDRLDLRRAENPHLAFGAGIHHCMGSEISRTVLAAVVGALVHRRLKIVALPQELRWKPYLATRGLESLKVHFQPL